MNRRYFFQQLASGLIAAAAPALFIPKLIKPGWKSVPLGGPDCCEVSIAWLLHVNGEEHPLMVTKGTPMEAMVKLIESTAGNNCLKKVETANLGQSDHKNAFEAMRPKEGGGIVVTKTYHIGQSHLKIETLLVEA